jgi:acyl-CoA ligase (AMP-forming) (exosortase A-associated)
VSRLLHHLLRDAAGRWPDKTAYSDTRESIDYAGLWDRTQRLAGGLLALGLAPGERVAIQLPRQIDHVALMFACAAAGCVMVPVNPLLRHRQVAHILRDSGARVLVTNRQRAEPLRDDLSACPALRHLVLSDPGADCAPAPLQQLALDQLLDAPAVREPPPDGLAALFYTSGSTGQPKGVMLSHANLVCGADSVNAYLHNNVDDRILALLPFSFDYGFSQLSCGFQAGASVIGSDYLLPQMVPRQIARLGITALAGVPTLWNALSRCDWPQAARNSLRYLCNSGGHLPLPTLQRLRKQLPGTEIHLMYGLTEAFRSTSLDPGLVDRHPDSIGVPIPNAEIHVLDPSGQECAIGQPGELVHAGPLVAQGYWGQPEATQARFRDWRGRPAVWSGDQVVRRENGLLYFVGRQDQLIKTSGYRVSPEEIESVALSVRGVHNAVALGEPDAELGERVLLYVEGEHDPETLQHTLHAELPHYMQPAEIRRVAHIPLSPNGKPDREALRS